MSIIATGGGGGGDTGGGTNASSLEAEAAIGPEGETVEVTDPLY